jgi:hypothetical protein
VAAGAVEPWWTGAVHRGAAFVVVVVVGLALSACGGDGTSGEGLGAGTAVSDAGPSTTAPPATTTTTTVAKPATTAVPSSSGLRATIEESRHFANMRRLSLEMRAVGPNDVEITTIRLSSPLFEPVEATPRETTVRAGAQLSASMPLDYGIARCGEVGPEPSVVEVTVGGAIEILPLDGPSTEWLEEVHDDECAVREVTDSVALTFGDDWEPAGDRTLSGRLVFSARQDGVEATLDDLRSSIVYSIFAEGAAPLAVVDGDVDEDTVDVRVVASRCDPHALTEASRKYIFTAFISVDGREPQAIEFTATGEAQKALNGLLEDCMQQHSGG